MRTLPPLVPLGLILACSGPVDVVVGEPRAPVIASYVLVSVNGRPLPTDLLTSGYWDLPDDRKIVHATLDLRTDGTWDFTWVLAVRGGTVPAGESVHRGTWVRIGDTLRFDGEQGSTGMLTSEGLTWQWSGDFLLSFVETDTTHD